MPMFERYKAMSACYKCLFKAYLLYPTHYIFYSLSINSKHRQRPLSTPLWGGTVVL